MPDIEQQEQLTRVRSKTKPAILAFARHRIDTGKLAFNIRDLHDWVVKETTVAPASPDRVLRDLRQRGHFDYEVTNRAKAEYVFKC